MTEDNQKINAQEVSELEAEQISGGYLGELVPGGKYRFQQYKLAKVTVNQLSNGTYEFYAGGHKIHVSTADYLYEKYESMGRAMTDQELQEYFYTSVPLPKFDQYGWN